MNRAIETTHLINKNKTLLEALSQINGIEDAPLVLFVVDEEARMVGTLTDGDARRALIGGAKVSDLAETVMHRNFNYLSQGKLDDVESIKRQRELRMKLVPVLDEDRRIVDIINLERYVYRLPVDAVLMAGGKGERLRPLTEKTPKPLLHVGEKTIIDHNVDRLVSFGLRNITVTVNYLGEQIEKHFAEPRRGVQVRCVREPRFLGTIGSVKFVPGFDNDTILIMNSDLFTNINYEDFYLHFKKNGADMSVAAVPYTVSVPYGIFDLEGRNIRGLVEKPTYNYYANAGIYLIRKGIVKDIPDDTFFNATDLIEQLIREGKKVIRFPLNGTWIDIGNPQEYAKAQELVRHIEW